MRIGLLGGSFNPAHGGHLHASLVALKGLKLDYVWWLVSPQNPLKSERGMGGLPARLAGARTLVRDRRIIVTDIETQFGIVYTVDTLSALQHRFPRAHFVWLMGSDNLLQLPRWRRWQEILRLLPIAVVARPGSALRARTCKAVGRLGHRFRPAGSAFATSRAPSLTILDARRDPSSATRLRGEG